jgi:hypothetical protein
MAMVGFAIESDTAWSSPVQSSEKLITQDEYLEWAHTNIGTSFDEVTQRNYERMNGTLAMRCLQYASMSFSTVSKIFFEIVNNAIIRRQDRICSWATSTQDFNRRVTLPQFIGHMVRT